MGCRVLAAAGLALTLAACAEGGFERGESGVRAEFARLDARSGTRIVDAGADRAHLVAAGRDVLLRPTEGFCIEPGSIDTSRAAAFVLIAECPPDPAKASPPAHRNGDLVLPKVFPGLYTVSVSTQPMGESPIGAGRTLAELEAFLRSPEGLGLIGRGGGSGQVRLIETRSIGGALYVHVEDSGAAPLPILAPEFWRAFVELNDRMALVTISGFRDVPVEGEALLAHLAAQVALLRAENGAPEVGEEVLLAKAAFGQPGGRPGGPGLPPPRPLDGVAGARQPPPRAEAAAPRVARAPSVAPRAPAAPGGRD